MENLIAIIPARKSDNILPGKNLLPMGDTNLLEMKIKQLKLVPQVDRIIVSSDCDEYCSIASQNGVSYDLRPIDLSMIETDFGDFVNYIASKYLCNHIMWAPTITPFINNLDYSTLIKKYFIALNDGNDSLITVNKLRRNILDDNGPLNFTSSKSDFVNLPNMFEYVNGVSIAKRCDMINWKYNWGRNPIKIELGKIKSFDICDEEDYSLAKMIFNSLNE